jgi:2-polyprenyl-3-methyl-5-hydroxy-6-metoxy-1,4-benzoquinol methylase
VDIGPTSEQVEPGHALTRAACSVCESQRLKPLPAYRRAHLARCRACGLVFAARLPTDEELDRNYGSYSRADYDSPITRRRYGELLDGFERYRRTNRILDMGCGVGFFLEEAQRRGWEAHGSELEPRALEINRAKGLRCVQAPVAIDAFEPGSFDVVTAFEVVEHLQDPLAEAAVIAHVLRPGGLLYCTTPNFASLSRRLLRERWSVVAYPEHLLYFTPSTLRGWLARFGFAPVKIRTTGLSLARLRRGVAPAALPRPRAEEQLRVRVEGSRALRAATRAANLALGAARAGDTIKGHFELRPR